MCQILCETGDGQPSPWALKSPKFISLSPLGSWSYLRTRSQWVPRTTWTQTTITFPPQTPTRFHLPSLTRAAPLDFCIREPRLLPPRQPDWLPATRPRRMTGFVLRVVVLPWRPCPFTLPLARVRPPEPPSQAPRFKKFPRRVASESCYDSHGKDAERSDVHRLAINLHRPPPLPSPRANPRVDSRRFKFSRPLSVRP